MIKCKGCNKNKDESEFYKWKGGYRGKCKSCFSDMAKARRERLAQSVGHNQAKLKMPSQESLKKLFNYHEDGFFVRKIPRGTQKAGSECRGKMEASGYRRMPINHDLYLAHRLIWKWHYGTEPECIDHINHDRGDNRIENLRSVTRGENCQHQLLPCNNSSGYFGVRYYDYDYMPQSPCWSAQITVNSEKIHIGYFNDKLSAVKAYNEACDKIHGEFGKDKIQHNIAKLKEEGLLK